MQDDTYASQEVWPEDGNLPTLLHSLARLISPLTLRSTLTTSTPHTHDPHDTACPATKLHTAKLERAERTHETPTKDPNSALEINS